jgi:DNA-nicking Smr family endonuclease
VAGQKGTARGKGAKRAASAAVAIVSRPFAKLSLPAKPARAAPEPSVPEPPRADAELDDLAFEMHMRDVRKLEKKSTRIPTTQSSVLRIEKPARVVDPDTPAREALAELVAAGHRFEVVDDGALLEGRRMDADPRELRRLRTGRYAIDGKLDLHEMTAAKAKRAVLEFVAKRRREGDRAVLIIHGKGSHSAGGKAILRGELGAWLSQSSAAKDVLAFASWLDRDSESGALCVLLARR